MSESRGESPNPSGYTLRHPEFARRMEEACDGHPSVPQLNHGRLTWFRDNLAEKGIDVRVETIRRWFGGFSYPRKDAMMALAQILQVDPGWLSAGSRQSEAVNAATLRKHVAVTSAALNIVAGFMQLDGAHPAFPQEGDREADSQKTNLYAIIRGIKHSFHVALLNSDEQFEVPVTAEGNYVLGVVPSGRFAVRIFELDWETIHQKSARKNASYMVDLVATDWREIESFSERL